MTNFRGCGFTGKLCRGSISKIFQVLVCACRKVIVAWLSKAELTRLVNRRFQLFSAIQRGLMGRHQSQVAPLVPDEKLECLGLTGK